MQDYLASNTQDALHDLAILKEWGYIQHNLLTFAAKTSYPKAYSWSLEIETIITRSTQGLARLYWEPIMMNSIVECDRLAEIRYKQTRYGFLGLVPGYLSSRHLPNISQDFASLCALLLAFAEYQTFVDTQMNNLPPLHTNEDVDRLTRRERDVLLGLVRGESDEEMAQFLGIESSTIHSHRKRLYRRLEVHNAQEAAMRSFACRLLDWLNNSARNNREKA